MCGICGLYGQPNRKSVEAMVAAMRHRGPDDSGTWIDNAAGIALGNTRLAIQDVSPAGHMPMTDGACWITYNGETYNFPELRIELEKYGHRFVSGTDTEVILAAYRQWGIECLRHLRGMFALAIYDPREGGRLFLARDRFGIKPLYWARIKEGYLFASELKSLLASEVVPRTADYQAIWDYFSVGSVIPPRTIIQGVQVLLPGHAMLIQNGRHHIWRWWDLLEASQHLEVPKNLDDAVCEVRRLLKNSVRSQMIADVPVGAFLSGGIDSTSIVGLMSEFTNQPVRTYSVAFETARGTASELPYARIASERFCTDHEEIILNESDILARFDQILMALDQPSFDGINSYVVSEAARRGVTVSLSGLGADEIFAGYPQFGRFMDVPQYFSEGSSLLAGVSDTIGSFLPGRWRLPLEFRAATPVGRYSMIRRVFTEREKQKFLNAELLQAVSISSIADYYASLMRNDLDPVAQTSYVETHGYMAHTLLRDVDVMSMAHSLEVRVPFLDHSLAEFVFALPAEWKWNQGLNKFILRQAMHDLLPATIINRSKMGFDLPVGAWVQDGLKSLFMETLESSIASMVLSDTARQLFKQQLRRNNSYSAWSILVLLRWMIVNRISLSL
jgi:asparagine synthase (glutamine-hydrolysing)